MSEQIVRPAELRKAVQKLGAALLEASKTSDVPPLLSIRQFLPPDTSVPWLWEQKADRYGSGNAISGRMREHAIEGRGPEARFRYIPDTMRGRKPKTRMQHGVRQILATTARHLNTTDGGHEAIMERYSELSAGLPSKEGAINLGRAILGGGDYREGICEYSFVASELMEAEPGFAAVSAEGRRDVAHGLLRRAIGREASMHGVDFIAASTILELHEDGEVGLQSDRSGEYTFDLATHRQAAHLRDSISHATPVLTCPAHLVRPGEPESDLQTFVHAGVNFAYDLSMFGAPQL